MKFEKEFAQLLFRNAVIFIDSAIGYINKGLDSYVNMLQAIVNLQFAMELALKSSVVSYCGIRTVLVSRQSNLSDSEIEDLYSANKLKVREFDDIKNFTKGKKHLYNFERKEYQYMELFQKYRNCVLHSAYVFSEQERRDAEKDIMYALIHILGILMSGENTADRHFFGYVNCGYCGEEMVICDAVNIEYNNNYIRGYCLNCDNDTTVYKCPKCGQFINAELFDKTKCHEGFCSVFE
jgi:hypothetical protein